MQSGRLTKRVTFERRTRENSGGVAIEDWNALAPSRMPASVEPLNGERAERQFGGDVQVQGLKAFVVGVRYRSDLRLSDRVLYHAPTGDRVLQILGLDNVDERDEELQVACVEVDA